MSPGRGKRTLPSAETAKLDELSQLKKDLDGLERLQALQTTLISEIRRQMEELRSRSANTLRS